MRITLRTILMRLALAAALAGLASPQPRAQHRLNDESDRQAFRDWFVFLADARFYDPAPDVTDCAALVRHAWREALRQHTTEWRRLSGLTDLPPYPDVKHPPPVSGASWPLFRVSASAAEPYLEFADARTLVRFNTRPVSREWGAARPGDLLYFRQPGQPQPDHLMIVVGRSRFDPSASDFIVYHTGPDDTGPGEVRKVRLADLRRHPAPRWRPLLANPAFVGVFRPAPL